MPTVESRIRIGIFELLLLLGREIIERHDDRDGRADERQDLQEAGESSTTKLPPKVTSRPSGRPARRSPPPTISSTIAQPVDQRASLLAAVGAEHQQRHGAERQHDLRQRRQQVDEGERSSFMRLTSPAAGGLRRAERVLIVVEQRGHRRRRHVEHRLRDRSRTGWSARSSGASIAISRAVEVGDAPRGSAFRACRRSTLR